MPDNFDDKMDFHARAMKRLGEMEDKPEVKKPVLDKFSPGQRINVLAKELYEAAQDCHDSEYRQWLAIAWGDDPAVYHVEEDFEKCIHPDCARRRKLFQTGGEL